ncbi:MAG TPA: TauD/TfdA family dioxygenase [Thermoanaerobaculia bacterium]
MTTGVSGLKKLNLVQRKLVSTSVDDLVREEPLLPDRELPVKLEPATDGVSLLEWVRQSRERIDSTLLRHGGILFRGFSVESLERFEEIVRVTSGELMQYTYRSTPRSEVAGRVYTSTEYPADQWIPMHNEMSYTSEWPLRIAFFCVRPAERGGETPIADSRRVYQRIHPEVRARFAEKGVMYVRNYSPGLDVSWQNVFQTSDQAEVERFCQQAGIELEWKEDGGLRTRQVCQGVARHPITGAMVWFNQAHLFHVSSLAPEVRAALLARHGERDLPRNAYFGDGSPIDEDALEEVRQAYRSESVDVPWRNGDLVLLDNMLAAHGRAPFSGPRKIVVAMAGAVGPESAGMSPER